MLVEVRDSRAIRGSGGLGLGFYPPLLGHFYPPLPGHFYPPLPGHVLARLFPDRGSATAEFIGAAVTRWLAGPGHQAGQRPAGG